jgi:eukaryotic-like serine/threonine-protein kinase
MTAQDPERLSAVLAGRYRIERELGQGGMATVYLAHDLRHDRPVALKVLRAELAAVIGAERFLAEIKTTANLQHPHILPLFDSGEAEGFLYYVMPYVEGESLRDRLTRERQLPVEEAVRIAREVAEALEYAHEQGVIHRDVKPENILLHGGHALVADFGIALAVSRSEGGTRLTETGMSLGTPHYMAPEQAMGEKEITPKADVYALGCVLYEMLAGEPPFTGPTAQAIVARVMTEQPRSLQLQRHTIPAQVESAVLTALEKLPADRFETAKAFAGALHDPAYRRGVGADEGAPGAATRARSRDPVFLAVAAVALLGVGAGLWGWRRARATAAETPRVYDVALPDSAAMDFAGFTPSTPYGSPLGGLSLSPDGSLAVYVVKQGASTQLWRRSLLDTAAAPIPGTEGASAPRISPDGSRLAFVSQASLMTVPMAGGQPRALADLDGDPYALEWIAPTTLMVVDQSGLRLRRIDLDAGTIDSRPVAWCFDGSWMPGEGKVLCDVRGVARVVDPATGRTWALKARAAGGGPSSPLAGFAFRLVDGRYLVYESPQGELRAARYDPATHTVGRSVSLLASVRVAGVGAADFDIAPTGTLLFATGGNGHIGRLVDLPAGGVPQPLPVPADAYERWDLSRDGRWLAAVVGGPGYYELRLFNLPSGQSFTWLRAAYIDQPLWGADDSTLIVQVQDSTGAAILRGPPSSAAAPDTFYASTDPGAVPLLLDWSAPHQALGGIGTPRRIVRFDPLAHAARFDTIAVDRIYAMLSPDGRHAIFSQSAGSRILMTANPPGAWERQVASSGVEPLWLSGSEVLYRSGFTWHLVHIAPATGEPAATASVWGSDPRFFDTIGWSNRPDWRGGIVYLEGPADTRAAFLRVIPHWVRQMERAVDGANR